MADNANDTPAPKITPEEYGNFIDGIELTKVYLSDAKVRRIRTPTLDTPLSFGQEVGKNKFNNVEGGFTSTFNLHVTLLEDGNDKPFGDINVTYTAEYNSAKKMTKDIFEIFGSYNLPLNLYPYVREYVHTTTNRMGMPTLILPTFKTS